MVAAIGATLVATAAAAQAHRQLGAARGRWSRRSARCRRVVALLDRDLAAYHGVEHKAIAAYEQGIDDPAGVPKEHDRCGSNLIAPMMLLSAGGTVLLERLVEQPGPARARRRSGSAAPRSRSRCSPGAIATTATRWPRPSTRPGREIQRLIATKEPTPEQLEVGIAALAEILRAEQGDRRRAAART